MNRERAGTDPYRNRIFHAAGGYNTLYLVGVAAALGYQFGGVQTTEIVPTRALLTKPGFKTYFSRAGLWVFLPVTLAYTLGISAFGNPQEYAMLSRHRNIYKTEIKNYQQELYYS